MSKDKSIADILNMNKADTTVPSEFPPAPEDPGNQFTEGVSNSVVQGRLQLGLVLMTELTKQI